MTAVARIPETHYEIFGSHGKPFIVEGRERHVVIVHQQDKFDSNGEVVPFIESMLKTGLSEIQDDLFNPLLEYGFGLHPGQMFHLGIRPLENRASSSVRTKVLSLGTLTSISWFPWPPEPHIMAMFNERRWLFEWHPSGQ